MCLAKPLTARGRFYFIIWAAARTLATAGLSPPEGALVLLQLNPPGASAEPALKGDAVCVVPYPQSLRVLRAVALCEDTEGTGLFVEILLPRSAFDRIAENVGARRMETLSLKAGQGLGDTVLEHLGASLEEAFDPDLRADGQLIDDLGSTFLLHLAQSFGRLEAPPQTTRGGLATWQLRLARNRLDQNLEEDLALDQIAAECGLSISHFTRAFSVSTGVPPHRWLMHRRIDRAKGLILSADVSLAQIAATCGFADQSHFTRTFASLVGLPPARWRIAQEQVWT
jgi:AraC family transcriptional regulator